MKRNLMNAALGFAAMLASGALYAEIYRCTIDGRTVFSDRKCASDAAVVMEQENEIASPPPEERRITVTGRPPEPLSLSPNPTGECMTAEYRSWALAQPSTPSNDQAAVKLKELGAMCQKRLGLPSGR